MAKIDRYLEAVKKTNGSDLHIQSGIIPKVRIHGQLEGLKQRPPTQSETEELLFEILSPRQKKRFDETGDLDFAYPLDGVGRFRTNFFRHQRGMGAVFRLIPTEILPVKELGVPEVVEKFCHLRSGLILVTGPTGSGKTTTLAALIDYINRNFDKHIITVEDPIEFVHEDKRSVISQREVGPDTESFADALRSASRQDPDVLLVGEMRDLETMRMAVTLAEMGQIVFATLHTNNAAKTIDRMVDVFPEEQQNQIRTMLSVSLKGVVSQLLCLRAGGKGRAAVTEIMFGSLALSNLIREGAVHKIASVIEGGRSEGMRLMDDSIMERLQAGEILAREAYMKAIDKRRFEPALAREQREAEMAQKARSEAAKEKSVEAKESEA
ncbi:MAG: type IV pilus twitching motility protein PilT [Planctomycetota bacterium]|nr:type IV pilus twitching motility protein PilT [Planctomycetota bacterium]